ncbi:carboxypeptidase-like regulatory domain-containing protein [Croceimicrobium sp.]|uniref:carboxypeptidase-like regulatory domain-containing protein n=1 Tax=Croceimicrobium sp. TaxID=2828340 RepID=UPI003BAB85E7
MEQIDLDSTKKDPVDSTWINGTIVDKENGESIPLANIFLKGGTAGCSSDFDGHFKFPQALKEGDTLMFTFIGFKPYQYIVKADQSVQNIKIQMEMAASIECGYMVMGEVASNQKFGSKPSLWKRITSLFRD